MGCCSTSQTPQPEHQRRRLSVGAVEKDGDEVNAEVSEDDRGLMQSLQGAELMEMVGNVGDRKFSIGSDQDQGKTSFANKTTKAEGAKVDPSSSGLGYTCRKGLKPESPNQDSWTVLKVDGEFAIYGVFDGHGQKGHDVSNYVKNTLVKLIVSDQRFRTDNMHDCLKDSFKKMQNLIAAKDRKKELSAQMAGTTCSICVHDFCSNKLTFAHVADSTIVLGKGKEQNVTGAEAMTRDHKPDLADERARIEKAGGRVVFDGYANHRVYAKNARYPGLNMSRCLGDLMGHADAGCSCEPEVKDYTITADDTVLLVCSDGVWEFMTPQEAVQIVMNFAPSKAMMAAERLAKEAWDRWIQEEGGAVVDDITVVLVYLKEINRQQRAD